MLKKNLGMAGLLMGAACTSFLAFGIIERFESKALAQDDLGGPTVKLMDATHLPVNAAIASDGDPFESQFLLKQHSVTPIDGEVQIFMEASVVDKSNVDGYVWYVQVREPGENGLVFSKLYEDRVFHIVDPEQDVRAVFEESIFLGPGRFSVSVQLLDVHAASDAENLLDAKKLESYRHLAVNQEVSF